MSRMKILSPTEVESFDNPPIFNSEERKRFFNTSSKLMKAVDSLRTPCNKIGFLLACGYFRATKKFFLTHSYHKQDIEYVARIIGLSEEYQFENYANRSHRRHEIMILDYFGYKRFDNEAINYITQEISMMVCIQLKPKLIFWRCVDILINNHYQVANYDRLSKIILTSCNQHKRELVTIIDRELTQDIRSLLESLFSQESEYSRYKLTLLKKLSQSTKPTKVKERVDDLLYLKELYGRIEKVLSALNLNHNGIKYYANSVIKSDIFQLNQRSPEDRYIHVIAFISHQYYRIQDNLADVLLTVVQSYQNSAAREHRDWCYENRKIYDQSLKSFLDSIDSRFSGTFSDMRNVIDNTRLTNAEKIMQFGKLLDSSDKVMEAGEELKRSLGHLKDNKHYFDILASRSIRLQNRISMIAKSLDFQAESGAEKLMEAIEYFRATDGNITKTAPSNFLETVQHSAVYANDTFHVSLYKVFLFIHIASALKSGTINLKHSYKYRPLDDYLISRERWQKEKNTLIERADLQDFTSTTQLLKILDKELYQQYQTTNQIYSDGKNQHLKIGNNKKFIITTPKQEEKEDNIALRPFFPEQQFVPITEILSTVNRHSDFLEEFQHWQQRYTKNRVTDKVLYAGIIGKGCAIGTPKIARISNQINENNLSNIINWYFSLENIQAANDRIIGLLDNMELPTIYKRSKEKLHTASDGQKFTVRKDSLNANYSFKYFGKEQGVSAYTFVDERNLLWHSLVFSAAERESAYVIDGLMRNDVVKSDIHSTDTHGYSEAIFAITYLLGFSYAPRIKNLKKQALYIFKTRKKSEHKEWNIIPDKYVNTDNIEETWDDILRLVATIKLKETTASEIFKRLNSYSKQHRVYQGLKAFGQIIKSQFILRYLDDVELRQSIEKQLNKVELANRFTRAVAVGDPRGFVHGEKEEQEISEACNRLIKNSIICWNYLYLSSSLIRLEKQPEQQKNLLSAIANHSVMSWAHINLLGEYDFSDEKLQDSFAIKSPKLLK